MFWFDTVLPVSVKERGKFYQPEAARARLPLILSPVRRLPEAPALDVTSTPLPSHHQAELLAKVTKTTVFS